MISVPGVHGAAELWTAHMGQALWQSTLITLLVLCAVRLGRRWPAPLRYGLLLVALLKFAVPPMVTSPVALLRLLPGPAAVPTVELFAPPSPPLATLATPMATAGHAQPAVAWDAARAPVSAHWQSWLLFAYLLGTSAVLVWIGSQAMRLRRLPSRCTEITEGALHDMLASLC